MTDRVVVIGPPRAGKTTYADARGDREGTRVRHTDDLIGAVSWSRVSEIIAFHWFDEPGPWIIEGVAAVRALRKWLRSHKSGSPCDEIVLLDRPKLALNAGQERMRKSCATIWEQIETELRSRGVQVTRP